MTKNKGMMNYMRITLGICICWLLSIQALTAQEPVLPNGNDLSARLTKLSPEHPRLFLSNSGREKFLAGCQTPAGRAIAKQVITEADKLLAQPVQERRLEGRRMLTTARAVLGRLCTLALAYELTHKEIYAERGIRETVNASEYADWNTGHFIDTAELTLAVALGYDWFHARLTPKQRRDIAIAICEKALRPSLNKQKSWWLEAAGNWGSVCHAGMLAGALAIYEQEPQLATTVIQRAVTHLSLCLKKTYTEGGAYFEGPTYWQYGSDFSVLALAMLHAALGSDFGITDQAPGFRQTGEFIAHAIGPTGLPFSYSDSFFPRNQQQGKLYFEPSIAKVWLSKRYGRPDWYFPVEYETELRVAERNNGYDRLFPLTLLFLTSGDFKTAAETRKLSYFSGNTNQVAIATHRSGWNAEAVYIGIKGGTPSCSHGHMDEGSFVLDADGVRWAEDLGGMDYGKLEKQGIKLWDSSQDGQRWKIFRYGPRSHNILTIDDQLQNVNNTASFTKFDDRPGKQFSELDLSAMYKDQAQTVTRSIQLLSNRQLVMRDQLTGLKPGAAVRWQMCTLAQADKITGATISLKRNGQTLQLNAGASTPGEWHTAKGETLMQDFDSLTGEGNDKLITMVYYTVRAPATGMVNLQVVFQPGSVPDHALLPPNEITKTP